MKSQNEKTNFDQYSQNYSEVVGQSVAFSGQEHDFFLKFKARLLLDLIGRKFADLKSIKVLDFGCGTGGMDAHLTAALPGLAGTDISGESIAAAKKMFPDIAYTVSSPDLLPYSAQSFDVVFAVCVFHHIAPALREQTIKEQLRILKPGGLLVIMEHNPFNPGTRLVVNRCELDRDAVLLRQGDTRKLLNMTGLRIFDQRYFLFFPFDNKMSRAAENALAWLPLGAQYFVAAEKLPTD